VLPPAWKSLLKFAEALLVSFLMKEIVVSSISARGVKLMSRFVHSKLFGTTRKGTVTGHSMLTAAQISFQVHPKDHQQLPGQ